jgi:hypothetical protein
VIQLICKCLFSLCREVTEINKQYWRLFIILPLLSLSGCQLLDESKSKKVDFSHYYLWIKSLSEEEIAQEIIYQKNNKQSGHAPADVELVMLYSLPKSPIHNPYTAKAMLNDYPLAPYVETMFSATDLAFIVMLKDQLNQQLLLLEQLTNYKGAYKQTKEINSLQQEKINQLNKQIIQLKKIEKIISKRGQ